MADYANGYYMTDPLAAYNTETKDMYLVMAAQTILADVTDFFPAATSIGLDADASYGVALWYPTKASATDSIKFASSWLPRSADIGSNQSIRKSGSGAISVYDAGFKERVINLTLKQVSFTKIVNLQILLVNIVNFALRTFQLEDESGTLYTVRWIDSVFPHAMPFYGLHDIVLRLRKEV